MVSCKSSVVSTRTERNTAVKSVAAPTCARVSPLALPFCCSSTDALRCISGKELDEFMQRHGGWEKFDRVVYVGDGGNDFCPLLRLRSSVVLPRMLFPFPSDDTDPTSSFQPRRWTRSIVPRTFPTNRKGGSDRWSQMFCGQLGRRVGGRAISSRRRC